MTRLTPLLLFLGLACAAPIQGTTIRGMDIDQVVADAELIFEGQVIDRQVRRADRGGLINTYVTFRVVDVLKGNYAGDTLELKFSGGTMGNEIIEVSGLVVPKAGEEGIYFVEALGRDLLNPLLGWSQGHYLIQELLGQRSMLSVKEQPVTAVQSRANIPISIKSQALTVDGDSAPAQGVVVDRSELRSSKPMSVSEFKSHIRALLN